MTEYLYDVFGLHIEVPHVHRLLPAATAGSSTDVVVRYGEVPDKLCNSIVERDNPLMRAHISIGSQGEVLWSAACGRFLVLNGKSVLIQSGGVNVRGGEVLRFVLSYCLPALLIQRGQMALHANAIATPAGAIVIGGASGAGKSTLLAALVAVGFPMLSDDVTAIRLNAGRRPLVAAGFPQYRLCADAVHRIAPAADSVRSLGGSRNKFSVAAPPGSFHAYATAVRTIYLIETHDCDQITVNSLHGADKLSALRAASYAPMCLTHLPYQVNALAAIASRIPVFRVRRPRARWTIDELVEMANEGQWVRGQQVGA